MSATATAEDARTERWMGVARWGAVTMVVWSVGLQLVAGSLIPPVAVIGVIFAVLAPFLRGRRPKLGLVVAILMFLIVVANAPIIIDDASHPESAPAFIFNLLSLTGAAVTVIGGAAAFRRADTARIRTVARVAPAVFVIGAFTAILLSTYATSDAAQPGDVELVASGVTWSADTLTVRAGDGLWVDNADGIRHVFAIESEGLVLDIPALKSRRVDVDLAPGSYAFVCTVPGHESMVGTLVVES